MSIWEHFPVENSIPRKCLLCLYALDSSWAGPISALAHNVMGHGPSGRSPGCPAAIEAGRAPITSVTLEHHASLIAKQRSGCPEPGWPVLSHPQNSEREKREGAIWPHKGVWSVQMSPIDLSRQPAMDASCSRYIYDQNISRMERSQSA